MWAGALIVEGEVWPGCGLMYIHPPEGTSQGAAHPWSPDGAGTGAMGNMY